MRVVVGVVALLIAAGAAAVAAVPLLALAPLFAVAGLQGGQRSRAASTIADIPPAMLGDYLGAATTCPGLSWTVLAGIGKVESDHGRGSEQSSAGAEGPMQFLPSTWAAYAVDADRDGNASIWDPADATATAAHYLCANGGGVAATLPLALFHYNHDWAYVATVLRWAAEYAGTG